MEQFQKESVQLRNIFLAIHLRGKISHQTSLEHSLKKLNQEYNLQALKPTDMYNTKRKLL